MKRFNKAMAALLSTAMICSMVPAMNLTGSAASAPGNIDLTRKVAAEGMVLMENNNGALPLTSGEKIALFGRTQIDYTRGGGGSGATNVDYTRNILQGLQIKEEEGKVSLYQPLVDFYTQKVSTEGIKNDANITVTDEMMDGAAQYASTAIMTIGRYSSEGSDRSAGKGDYLLSDAETELLTRLGQKFDKVVVVLNIGGVIDTKWITEIPGIDAVLNGWQAGMEGGLATADVLCGDVNPSGRLVDTWAKNYDDYSTSKTFNESNSYVNYSEDIYMGYRYFETFDPNYEKVNYEFGYGLSYTTFDVTDVTAAPDEANENMIITAKVTNTGDVAGKEVVQAYFSAPQGKLGKPAKELAAFDKTGLLNPGESEVLTMSYAIDDMSSYDDIGKIQKSAYVLEAGDYDIYVGTTIKDAGQKGVRYTYNVAEDVITEQLSQKCAPIQLKERMLADGSMETLPIDPAFDPYYTISATEPTVVQSENFLKASSGIGMENWYAAGQSGKCLAMFNAKDLYVEYDLTVEEAGTYAITYRTANGNAAMSNPFNVFVNDEQQPYIHLDVPQTGDGSGASEWYNFEDMGPIYVNLPAGHCTFKMVATKNNPNYDYMVFEKQDKTLNYYQDINAAGANKIEAEGFVFSGGTASNTVRTENFTVGDYSGTCLAYMNYAGNNVTYWLNVAEAGEYELTFNVANGRAAFNFAPGISINGEDVTVPAVNVPQTGMGDGAGEWYNFEDLQPVTVTLPAGKVALKLTSSGSYPNIDYILLEKKAAEVPAVMSAAAPFRAMSANVSAKAASDKKIMLLDVYNGEASLDDFIAQLSDEQLIVMSGGQPNTGVANTGGMGNLMEYGIPNIMTADGPQGIRIGVHCTAWPVSTLLACTWDVDLVYEVGKAAAVEARENGIDIWLAPGMNIHRNPLCGRNFEYYSEDPLLTGKLAASITKGCQSENVAISLKHFAANNKETNRSNSDSRMSERALREIYLKGFEIAVKEADPWTIMSSYNYINGTETAERYDLITGILRDEWGFKGLVETDWGNNSIHAKEVKAGNDVKMSAGNPANLRAALANGGITRAELERNMKRLMELIMKTNTFYNKIVAPPTVSIGDSTKLKLAENILWSGGSIRAEVTEDTDGGNNLGYCDAGTWVQYQIDVQTAGLYDVALRSASNAGSGAVDLLVDGAVVTSFKATNTGGWQKWITLEPKKIYLEAGKHEFRVNVTESGSNMNWLQFDLVSSISGGITVEDGVITDAPAALTPAQFKDLFTGSENIVIVDAQGNPVADDKLVGTGSKVQYLDGDKLVKEFTVIVPGDVDGDGTRGVMDLLAMKQSILGKEGAQLEGVYFTAADRDVNGKLNIFDLVRVKLDILNGAI